MFDTTKKGRHFVHSLLVRIGGQWHLQLRWHWARHKPEPLESQSDEAGFRKIHICVGEVLGEDGQYRQWLLVFFHGPILSPEVPPFAAGTGAVIVNGNGTYGLSPGELIASN
jgi:hypothetical protein